MLDLVGLKGEAFVKITISSRSIKLNDIIQGYIDNKLSELEKYLSPGDEIKVTINCDKGIYRIILDNEN